MTPAALHSLPGLPGPWRGKLGGCMPQSCQAHSEEPVTTSATSEDLPDDGYVLARTSEEYQRLRRQARLWERVTAEALDRVGIGAGMRCLDMGCGPG